MTKLLSPGIRRIALEEFTARCAALRKAARDGGSDWAGDPANENATLWLAIAVAAGAGPDLPDNVRAGIERKAIFPQGKRIMPRPDQIAAPDAYRAELARARDMALRKSEARPGDLKADQRARDLIALADALGAPGIDWSDRASSNAAVGHKDTEQGRAAA